MKTIFIEGIQGMGKSTLVNRLSNAVPEFHVCREGGLFASASVSSLLFSITILNPLIPIAFSFLIAKKYTNEAINLCDPNLLNS